jgi:SseB protein N-terminal domain
MTTPGSLVPADPADSPPDARQPGTPQPGTPQLRGGPDRGSPVGEGLDLPEIVIAPAHPAFDAGHPDVVFELRDGADGAPVLPVFSSVHRLVSALGHAQPWVALPLLRVRELAGAGGIHTVILDPEVAPGTWRWHSDDLERLEESLEGSTG